MFAEAAIWILQTMAEKFLRAKRAKVSSQAELEEGEGTFPPFQLQFIVKFIQYFP